MVDKPQGVEKSLCREISSISQGTIAMTKETLEALWVAISRPHHTNDLVHLLPRPNQLHQHSQ